MERFVFGTKAETLGRLGGRLTKAVLLDQFAFTVTDWEREREEVLRAIQKIFPQGPLVLRSSTYDEDTSTQSGAGRFESILGIPLTEEAITAAAEQVVASYRRKGSENPKNQVLVQRQIQNISASGVLFTKDISTHAPYIIINYDDQSGSSSSVTSGNGNGLKIFTFYKHADQLPSNPLLAQLIELARELEVVTGRDALDIEFAATREELYLLQVRPIASPNTNADTALFEETLAQNLTLIKEFITKNNIPYPNLHGYRTAYGIMPDWNPAEIIGVSPKPLAFSLYRHLITDTMWPLSRKLVGYKDVGHQPGMISLVGKPYIDIRMSLNTFLPRSLSHITSENLMNYYLNKLIMHPELHDKMEFEVALTAYSFDFDEKERELQAHNFGALQIREIRDALIELTSDIVAERTLSLDNELALTDELTRRRENILKTDIEYDIRISQLLHDGRNYGTLPFSKLARCAFIGNILLKSLVKKGIVSNDEYAAFFGSIRTVAAEFIERLVMLKEKKITKQQFLREFGHLRPGTYDINSRSYTEAFDDYIDLKQFNERIHPVAPFEFSDATKQAIAQAITDANLDFTVEQFIGFTRKAIRAREEAKFEFTKNIDLILHYCEEYLHPYGIAREDVAFLEIEDITRFAYMADPTDKAEWLREVVQKNKQQYIMTKAIRLPPLLYMEKNVDYFHLMDDRPNFITHKAVTGEVVHVTTEIGDDVSLRGKIVLIDSADPGYDWIFSHDIAGLITQYGGVASHMSIRAAEFNLPAAIGCGGALFEFVRDSKKIELNCATQHIRRIL